MGDWVIGKRANRTRKNVTHDTHPTHPPTHPPTYLQVREVADVFAVEGEQTSESFLVPFVDL